MVLLKLQQRHSWTIFGAFWVFLNRRELQLQLFTNRGPSFFLLFDYTTSFKTSKFEWTLGNIGIEKIILVPIWSTKNFFGGCSLVSIKKLMMQSWENDKNPNFRPNLGSQIFCLCVLALLVVKYFSKLSSCAI